MTIFTKQDLKNNSQTSYYHRGMAYYNASKVIAYKVIDKTPQSLTLKSYVEGSNTQLYEQTTSVSNNSGSIKIDGYCDCPVGHNCKHIIAGCIFYLNSFTAKDSELDSAELWLKGFTQKNPDLIDGKSNEFLIYTLQTISNVRGGTLSVSLSRHKFLQRGGLNRGQNIEVYNFLDSYSRPKYVQDIDYEIGRLLHVQNKFSWQARTYPASGELGYTAIKKIMATKRVRWLKAQGPELTLHEPRSLEMEWLDDKKGNKKLSLSCTPEATLLDTSPALYIDTQSHQIGELEGADFNEKQWQMLLTIPTIPKDLCAQFSHELLTIFPKNNLPTPQKIECIDLKETCQPNVLLSSKENHSDTTHTLRLRYGYAEHELNLEHNSPIAQVQKDGVSIRIFRDVNAEKKALQTLLDIGFQELYSEVKKECLLSAFSLEGKSPIEIWQQFIFHTIPDLEQQGWNFDIDDSFQLEFIEVSDWDVEIESDNEWFDLRFDLEIEGQKIPLLPLVAKVIHHYELDNLPDQITLPLHAGDDSSNKYLRIPTERIRPIFQTLYELFDSEALDADGNLRLNRFDAPRLADLEDSFSDEINWRGGDAMRQLGRKLKDFKGIDNIKPPSGLSATLRDYQQQGFNWLQFLREYQFNGILADDMGLGKTVQTLSHLLQEKESGRMDKPCLVLAPTSLMGNWRREAKQFTPALKLLTLQGSERQQDFDKINHHDIILSTYPLLVRDQDTLLAHDYHYLILDEAQVIKNPRAQAARVARDIKTRHRLCLTGTPMENHLGELWALFDFLMPGCLGKQKEFNQHFRKPIEKLGNKDQQQLLNKRIKPFMLRRSKSEVAQELPDKTEIIRSVSFDKSQAALYESIRLSMEKKVREAIQKKGLARSHIMILDALLKLRQTCCDPQLLSLAQAKKVKQSAKLDMLMEMLPEMLEEGRRILIFSQFTKMLSIIEKSLKKASISYTKLTGSTKKRDEVIDRFCNGEVNVFLISLKAGGVGLNLTQADTVIHYDPWWNPAVENQATDRAHRIGQEKAVFVYKLIIENTLEEKILSMQARKQALADAVYNGDNKSKDSKLNANDLEALFAPLES